LKSRSADRIVLLVDDDTAVRQMLARALAFEAFVVVEAANGLEALEQLRQGCGAGVIVLDLRMPVMDGWAFRRAQRADPKIAKTPVVVLSGADAHRFAELEALAAFEKPVRISELAVRLHQVFEDA
jgi:CheY-like chemotaxis protein